MTASVEIDSEMEGRLRKFASARRRAADAIVREAIQQYIEREEARESFKQEALESWAEFREDGRHLTGEEVERWLDTWGTEAETNLPKCHG